MPTAPAKFKPHGFKAAKLRDKDRNRPSAARRGYGKGWAGTRETVVAEAGFRCEMSDCRRPVVLHKREEAGRAQVAHVDHIDGDSLNRARDNLRCLCQTCHNTRTAREQGFGRAKPGWKR